MPLHRLGFGPCRGTERRAPVARGAFFRAGLGAGYASQFRDDYAANGFGGMLDLAAGYSVVPDIALFAEVAFSFTPHPAASGAGVSSGATEDWMRDAYIGGGATYYFMPANVHVTLAIGAARLINKIGGGTGSTDWGPGVRLMVGKEWPLSDSWGVGVAGQMFFATMSNPDGERWSTLTGAVMFTSTFH
jgi:hypothetical protein